MLEVLTSKRSLEPRNVFGWCQNESTDDAELTLSSNCVTHPISFSVILASLRGSSDLLENIS